MVKKILLIVGILAICAVFFIFPDLWQWIAGGLVAVFSGIGYAIKRRFDSGTKTRSQDHFKVLQESARNRKRRVDQGLRDTDEALRILGEGKD